MKVSYNWLQDYFKEKLPKPEKISEGIIFHSFEIEGMDKMGHDTVFDMKVLPDRAHDCLSHWGIAKELSAIFDIKIKDINFKVPESKSTDLKIDIQTDKCRRYMGRIVRNVKVDPSPDWVVKHLESIGQRSINNMVDAANLVMFNCGQPTHVFDLNKIKEKIVIRQAQESEELTTLDNKECKFKSSDMVIADAEKALAIAGIKGGKLAEVDNNTKNIILEVANFDPTAVRKTAQSLNIFTDARKRFENDLSPELVSRGMLELSALIYEMCPDVVFENVVDVYPQKAEQKTVFVSVNYINKRLGSAFSIEEIESVWKKLNFEYTKKDGEFEITIPFSRIDLTGAHDLTEEVIRILGYDRLEEKMPEIKLESKINETFRKMLWARQKLLNDGYSEVMTYTFQNKGEIEVLASASDKNFLRTNLTDGLKDSLKLNQNNLPLLGVKEVKIFEIGTVWVPEEIMHVAHNDGNKIIELSLDEFCKDASPDAFAQSLGSSLRSATPSQKHVGTAFKMWPLFPFIARDIAVWVPEEVESEKVCKVIKENAGELVMKGPDLFDQFKKLASPAGGDSKVSYAFRIVFQSYDRTLTDAEINEIMQKVAEKITANGWQVR